MKQCPSCGRTFDDEYDFCLEDGARLVTGPAGFPSSGEIPTQYVPRPLTAQPTTPAGSSSKWLFLIIGLLSVTAVVCGFLLFFQRSRDNSGDKKPEYETVKTENSPAATSTPEPRKSVNPVSSPVVPPPPPVPPRPAVSNARVRFAKGAVTSSVSGSLSEGEVRNYLLECRAGQQLTATLSTSDRCITFTDGSTIFRSITRKGDNTVAVTNRCSNGGGYRLDITIL